MVSYVYLYWNCDVTIVVICVALGVEHCRRTKHFQTTKLHSTPIFPPRDIIATPAAENSKCIKYKKSVKYGLKQSECQIWSAKNKVSNMVWSDRATNILSASAVSLWLPSGPNPGPMSHHRAPPPVWGEGLSPWHPKIDSNRKSVKCLIAGVDIYIVCLIKPGSSEIKEKILSMLNLVTHLLPPAPWFIKELQCWWCWRGLHDGKSRADRTNHHQFEQIYF